MCVNKKWLLDINCIIPHIEKTTGGFTNKNKTRNEAMQTRLIKAENPTAKVAIGLSAVDIEDHVPSHCNL